MTKQITSPPLSRRLLLAGLAGAAAVGTLLTVAFVLPAEYGRDPLGTGAALGLLPEPTRKLVLADVSGGNERIREVALPAPGQPIPLPNPAVHQDEAALPGVQEIRITVPPEKGTEYKLVMQSGKAVVYSWQSDRGTVYADFHGHDPSLGEDQFVRYKEQQEGRGNQGSLVAPFAGEHGWYWLNYNAHPVTITLKVQGYWTELRDHGIVD